jgi:hypothetical protein
MHDHDHDHPHLSTPVGPRREGRASSYVPRSRRVRVELPTTSQVSSSVGYASRLELPSRPKSKADKFSVAPAPGFLVFWKKNEATGGRVGEARNWTTHPFGIPNENILPQGNTGLKRHLIITRDNSSLSSSSLS